MKKYPKYFARPSDGTIFSLNEDGKTYSIKEIKEQCKEHISHKYEYDTMKNCRFEEVQENDFKRLEETANEYYAFMSWSSRSDGHGGIKGGTIEEFRNLKKQSRI